VTALTYLALPGNPNYLGPAPADVIAAEVERSHGPSGSNREYVELLARTLAEHGADEPHILEVLRALGPRR
jgi:cation transport protein ChaC